MKRYRLRLIFRRGLLDQSGIKYEFMYKTDDVYLPDNANAFQFPDLQFRGFLPEVVGGEWIAETEEEK